MDNGFFEKSGNGFWKKFIASGFTAIFTAGLFGSNAGKVVAVKEMESIQDQKILVDANDKDRFEKGKVRKREITPLGELLAFSKSISKEDREKAKLSPKENLLVVVLSVLIVSAIVVPILVCSQSKESQSAAKGKAKPATKPEGDVSLERKVESK